MGPQFFETRMGRKFYEHDVPELIQVLNRIADLLEKKPCHQRTGTL